MLERDSHPARFPADLPKFFVQFLTDPEDVVLDIFSGSNTTGYVAEQHQRRWLLGRQTSPTQAARRAKRVLRVQEALNSLDPIDRKVLALRHFEQLSRAAAAVVLGISQEVGAKRYFRALKRFKGIPATLPGGWECA